MGYATIFDLDDLTVWRAIFSIVCIIVSIIIGIKVISKFFKNKDRSFLTLGLTSIFFGTIYWGLAFNFISIVFFNYQFENELFLFLSYGFIPFMTICWFYSFAKIYVEYKFKQVFYPPLVIFSIYFILFIVLLTLDSDAYIAKHLWGYQYQRHLFLNSMVVISFFLVSSTWLLFSIKLMKSNRQLLFWKGRFLLFALFFMGGSLVIELFSSSLLELQLLTRILLIISLFLFYLGFFIPPKLLKKLIKESN